MLGKPVHMSQRGISIQATIRLKVPLGAIIVAPSVAAHEDRRGRNRLSLSQHEIGALFWGLRQISLRVLT